MSMVMFFGGESRTGIVVTPEGAEVFATAPQSTRPITDTATALSRIVEANTTVGDQISELSGTVSSLAATVRRETSAAVPTVGEDVSTVFVDTQGAVMITPGGTVHLLPLKTFMDTGATTRTLETVAQARDPTA